MFSQASTLTSSSYFITPQTDELESLSAFALGTCGRSKASRAMAPPLFRAIHAAARRHRQRKLARSLAAREAEYGVDGEGEALAAGAVIDEDAGSREANGNEATERCSTDRLVPGVDKPQPSQELDVGAEGRWIKLPKDRLYEPPEEWSLPEEHGDLAFGGLNEPAALRVIVVGTGFAGLAAAIACARQGYSVTACERSAGISPHGDSILFGANASRILYRWGVGSDMYRRGGNRGGQWVFKQQDGRPVFTQQLSDVVNRYGAPILQGRRSTFLGCLGTEARLLGVDIRLASEVVRYWDSREEPAVVLRGGEVLRADVIIVADGVHSAARRLLTPHVRNGSPRQPSGYSIYRSAIPSGKLRNDSRCSHLLDGTIRTWLGKDRHVCMYPMENGTSIAFTYTHRDVPDQCPASLDWRDRKPIAGMLKELEGWDPVLLAALSHFATSLHWTILDEEPEQEWVRAGGKICFIGDSVHAMMPTAFQGGSQAIEDGAAAAVCLAMAGGRPEDVPLALKVFEAMRRPRVCVAQALGQAQQDIWHEYFDDPSQRDDGARSGTAASLHPISFDLYGYDIEDDVLRHFSEVATAIDVNVHLNKQRTAEAAQKANIAVGVQRLSLADCMDCDVLWEESGAV
ncbi:hypothetical protein BMF94_4131 [Rhodotorula taiwanensis]|uniref:FAD-binding domain-containing protein n=1 Tax=Rhodotorula taiwanensis TaxID=741276 RepID=A0A2S5B7H0_9BASI|nr:hypothetical protein BMF94_4131 [Rhodotorula taiwanensis]